MNQFNVNTAPIDAIEGGQFFIKTLTGKTIVCSLNPEMTIQQVKEEIFKAEQIPIEQQRLVFQGKQLENNTTLFSNNVTDKACIHLVLRLRGGAGEGQVDGGQFFIKTLTGKTIVCSLNPEMTIQQVKEEIFKAEQIPIEQQRLVFQGKQLENNTTLFSNNITDKACIHLVLRLRGGAGEGQVDGGQFFIKTLTGKTIVCSLNPEMTIQQVKEEIFKAEQIPIEQQRLVFQGKQLENNTTLFSNNITDKACIHLVLRLRGGAGEGQVDGGQFFIKTLTGKTIVCSLNPEMTIQQVKEEIFKAEQIPIEQQRLVFQGKQLENNTTLFSNNITDKACIHLVLRLRG